MPVKMMSYPIFDNDGEVYNSCEMKLTIDNYRDCIYEIGEEREIGNSSKMASNKQCILPTGIDP